MHRPPRHMGNKAMQPMDSQLMSAVPRLRALPPTGKLQMQILMDSLTLVIPVQLPPSHRVSLSKDMALVLRTPPLLQSPQRRPLKQLSVHVASNLPTQPRVSSQQPPHLQEHRMVTSAKAKEPQSSTGGFNQPVLGYRQSNYSYSQVPGSYPMQPITTLPSYPPTVYFSSQWSSYDQRSYYQQNTYEQPSLYGQQSDYGQKSSYGQQPPTSCPSQTGSYNQASSQYSQQSSHSVAKGSSRVHCDRTTPVAWVFMAGIWKIFWTRREPELAWP